MLEKKNHNTNLFFTKCGLQATGCRPSTKYRMQTVDLAQNADWEFILFFRLIWNVTIWYLTCAIFEKQLTALHVVCRFHLFNQYVSILLTKMQTETKTVPWTWYTFNISGCTHGDFHICDFCCYWLTWGTCKFLLGKQLLSWLAICVLFWWIYLSSVQWLCKY